MSLVEMSLGEPTDCYYLDTSWLIRENRLLAMYESYTASRSVEQEPLTLDMVSKPFRRTVGARANGSCASAEPDLPLDDR